MILNNGDIVHIIVRRGFESDLRRHFVGEIDSMTESAICVTGFAFVFDNNSGKYQRKDDKRTRIFSIVDAGNIIFIAPDNTKLDNVKYEVDANNRLVVTDGRHFTLDINEFGGHR